MPEIYSLAGKRVYVAGYSGMVGSALLRRLSREDCVILTPERRALDLTRQAEVEAFFASNRPDVVVMAAARVGGILANETYPADFLLDNLVIETNVMVAAQQTGVEKFLFLGSSCIYPRLAAQPITEDALLTGPLEPTNEWYAIAKIAGIKIGQAFRRQFGSDFISAMPTNLYGPRDNFDLTSSHVLPALLRKAHEAKLAGAPTLTIWGSGTPRREFLHVDDCADALVFLLKNYSAEEHINVGSAEDISILELARLVSRIVGYKGKIVNDHGKPDGMPRKLMSADKLLNLGWSSTIGLEQGIAETYRWFLDNGAGA